MHVKGPTGLESDLFRPQLDSSQNLRPILVMIDIPSHQHSKLARRAGLCEKGRRLGPDSTGGEEACSEAGWWNSVSALATM